MAEAPGGRLFLKAYDDPGLYRWLSDHYPWRGLQRALYDTVHGVPAGGLLAPPIGYCRCARPSRRVVVAARHVEAAGGLEDLVEESLMGRPLPVEAAAGMARLIAGVVVVLSNQRVVHGDLRPANILVTAPRDPVVIDLDGASWEAEEPYYVTEESAIPSGLARPLTPGARDTVGLAWTLVAVASTADRALARDYYSSRCCTRRWLEERRRLLARILWPGALELVEYVVEEPGVREPPRRFWSILLE